MSQPLLLILLLGCSQAPAGDLAVTVTIGGLPAEARSLRVLVQADGLQLMKEVAGGLSAFTLDLPAGLSGKLRLEVAARDEPERPCVIATGAAETTARSVTVPLSRLAQRRCTVTLRKLGQGTVSSIPPGLTCGPQCHLAFADFDEGERVKLIARPAPGFAFTGWSGGCGGTDCCGLTLSGPGAATATFDPVPPQADTADGIAPTAGDCPPEERAGFRGVLTGVPVSTLTGWTECYRDVYSTQGPALETIRSMCPRARLLIGCRERDAGVLLVAANAPREAVFRATGTGAHTANGVTWYLSDSSFGFAPEGDEVKRASCDTLGGWAPGPHGDRRLCWHVGGGSLRRGWRCGAYYGLNFSSGFERVILQAD